MKHVVGDRADTLIWRLNFPRPLALQCLLRRTLRRPITQERVCNGNIEPSSGRFSPTRTTSFGGR